MKILKALLPLVAFGIPAARDSRNSQHGTDIADDSLDSDNNEQDKMFGYQQVIGYPSYQTYFAPNIGYPYFMNPMMNTMCTFRYAIMPAMPVLQQYPNPNIPVYGVPQYPQVPQQPQRPVPNPSYHYRPSNQGQNQGQNPNYGPPNQGQNNGENQGPQHGNGPYNGGQQNHGNQNNGNQSGGRQQGGQNSRPRYGNSNQGQNLGNKSFGDQIEDKFIPSGINPYPAPVPGFFDLNGMPCNPYMQTVYAQQPIIVG